MTDTQRPWDRRTTDSDPAYEGVLEIDPAYVDVTVKRWEDFTGRKATKTKGE